MNSVWATIRNVALVTVVTVLIWVFAEAETLGERDIRVPLQVAPDPGSSLVIDLVDRSVPALQIDVSLEGSAAALQRAERDLSDGVILGPSGLDGGIPTAPGTHRIDLRSALRLNPLFATSGVGIKKVEPETIEVVVDQLVTRDLDVQLAPTPGEVDGAPALSRTTVQVTLPKAAADKLPEEAAALARVDDATWQRLVPGRRETLAGVRLVLPQALAGVAHVRMDPPTVDVTLTPRTSVESIQVAAVPVHVRLAPTELNRWEIEIPEADRALINVTLTGPTDLVRKYADKPPVAVVMLSFEDLEKGVQSKEAEFVDAPPGVRIEAPNRTVRLTIRRRPERTPAQP